MVQGHVNLNTEKTEQWIQEYVDGWVEFFKNRQTLEKLLIIYQN